MYSAEMAAINFSSMKFNFYCYFYIIIHCIYTYLWFIYIYWILGSIIYFYISSFKCSFKDLRVKGE